MTLPPNEKLVRGDVVLVPMEVRYVAPESGRMNGMVGYDPVSVEFSQIHSVISRKFDDGEDVLFYDELRSITVAGVFHSVVNGYAVVSARSDLPPMVVPLDEVRRKPAPLVPDWSKVDPDFREVGEPVPADSAWQPGEAGEKPAPVVQNQTIPPQVPRFEAQDHEVEF